MCKAIPDFRMFVNNGRRTLLGGRKRTAHSTKLTTFGASQSFRVYILKYFDTSMTKMCCVWTVQPYSKPMWTSSGKKLCSTAKPVEVVGEANAGELQRR